MSGAHAAPKGRRGTDPDLKPPSDKQHEGWASDLTAPGWSGPAPAPPAGSEPKPSPVPLARFGSFQCFYIDGCPDRVLCTDRREVHGRPVCVGADGDPGPAPEPPASEAPADPGHRPAASAEPATIPHVPEVIASMGAIRTRPESVALDRDVAALVAEADKVLRESAAEREAREQQDIRDRGQKALIGYAGALPSLPYATEAAERPAEGDQK
jgi:hypothetical protein